MSKRVFITEKPSVAREFANSLEIKFRSRDGYMESEDTIITWCVGHLVTMCYPDAYDPKYKKWSLSTIPFIPQEYKYHVLSSVKKQFHIVSEILTDKDVDTIYICTDSGREGEYIYRLVAQQAGVNNKRQLRVWIDSQTKEEILRGIKEAKDDSEYDALGAAAYLRAKEDYLMGINFSRALTLKYGQEISSVMGTKYTVIAVGRVMTCVLGMVVGREREIRNFVKTPFYRVVGDFIPDGSEDIITAEWHVTKESPYFETPALYNEKGFKKKEDALRLITSLQEFTSGDGAVIHQVVKKKERKQPPMLYNLAELQNDCARLFKISPDQTLQIAQELYEKKLTTYPRTDARVLSTAVAKEIGKNLKGISQLPMYRPYLEDILKRGSYHKIGKTKYTNDKAITDHYAIIPTGQGIKTVQNLSATSQKVYELIVRRFLAIFYPPAVFDKINLEIRIGDELFSARFSKCTDKGYLSVMEYSFSSPKNTENKDSEPSEIIAGLKKGSSLSVSDLRIKESETSPPKRYNSGSMILAMENAGQLIEEEELREQIKGSGIGTSATRAEILKKLVNNQYLSLNKKTQVITPTQMGEMIYDTVNCSLRSLLDPKLTASWEIGLDRVSKGQVTEDEYLDKLNGFITRRTNYIKETDFSPFLRNAFREDAALYAGRRRAETSGQSKRANGNRTKSSKK